MAQGVRSAVMPRLPEPAMDGLIGPTPMSFRQAGCLCSQDFVS